MSIQQNQIVQPTYNGQDIYYRTPVDAIITDGMSLDDYIRNTTGVVESGSNSNGSYIKFADGTLIQEGDTGSFTIPASTGGSKDVTFPINFYDTNYCVTQTNLGGGTYYSWVAESTTNKTISGFTCSCWNNTSAGSSTTNFSWIAIGRWKDYDVSVLPDQQQSTIINSASTNYSYDEKVIGLWSDFKPLYRKMFYSSTSISLTANTWTNLFNVSNLNIERLVNGDILGDQSNTNTFGGSFQISTSDYLQAFCPFDYGNFHYAYIEYTKTTDSPVTSQTKDLLTVVNGKNITDLDTIIKQRVDQVIHESLAYDRLGKLLWSGSFTSGTLNVPGISKYKVITVRTANLMMIGNQYYGGLAFRAYRSQGTACYGYRYTYDATAETLTTTTDNPGATDGTNNIAITEIYGIF